MARAAAPAPASRGRRPPRAQRRARPGGRWRWAQDTAMSHQRGRGDAGDAARVPHAEPGRIKRRRTRGERNRAKFGPGLQGARWRGGRPPWGGVPPPRATQPPPSPLPPPRPVIITQQRLSRPRGLLGRGVMSMDIKRLLVGEQGAEHPPQPPTEGTGGPAETPPPTKGLGREGQRSPSPPENPPEGAVGDRDSPSARTSPQGLAAHLCALLPHPPEFWGRALAEERRRAVLAVLLERHRALPDLAALLPHRSGGGLPHSQPLVPPAASHPPSGLCSPEAELLPQPTQSRDPALRHSHPSTPPRAIIQAPTSPACFSPPVFSTEMKKRQSWFPWMSEDEDDAHPKNPAPQFWVRTPSPPPFRPTSPARSPASHPPAGHCMPKPELLPQPRQSRDPAPHHCRCHDPPQAVTPSPSPPAIPPPPIFGAERKQKQSWFPWVSEDEDDPRPENPAPLFWVQTPSPPPPPLFRGHPPPRVPLGEPGCTCGAAWEPGLGDTAERHSQIRRRSRVPRHHRVSRHPLAGPCTPPHPHRCHGDQQTPPALYRGMCPCAPSPPRRPYKHSPCPHSWPQPTADLPMCHCSPPNSYRPRGWRGPLEPRHRGWHLSCCPRTAAPRRAGEGDSSPNAWLFPCLH